MTQERSQNVNEADTRQSEHEQEVAQYEEGGGEQTSADDATVDEGRRPSSDEDLAADMSGGNSIDADIAGDDQSSPGQNSDRLPQ